MRAAPIQLEEATGETIPLDAAIRAARPGTLHGVAGWFEAQLSPEVTLTNSPLSPERIDRLNVYYPIDEPVALDEGDEVRITMRIRPVETIVAWTVEVWTGHAPHQVRKARFRHSTVSGLLLSTEELERTRPDHVPVLDRRGEARRTLLDLCDGTRSIAEIEQRLHERHPDQFGSARAAGPFVAEVVTEYSR